MTRVKTYVFLFGIFFLASSAAVAQFSVISAQDVISWMTGKRKVVLIDTRTSEEYRAGHIPGAICIPAEKMKAEEARLPRDKSTAIIFYCRGIG